MLLRNAGADLAMWNPPTQDWWVLAKSSWTPYRFSTDGCRLLVGTLDGSLRWVDLEGHVVEDFFDAESLTSVGVEAFGGTTFLSPNERWIGYWLGSGRPSNQIGIDLRMEKQNLFTYSIDLVQGPNPISTSGGAYVVEWSPDSRELAFSDYDQNHVHQVFVSEVDGSGRRQLTQFASASFFDDDQGIRQIVWSPGGAFVAVESLLDGTSQVSVLSATVPNQSPLDLESAGFLWWVDGKRFLFSDAGGIHEADLATGARDLLVSLPTNDVDGRFLPFAGTHIGIFQIGTDSYLFDADRSTWGRLGQVPDPTFWPVMTTPAEFNGTASCP